MRRSMLLVCALLAGTTLGCDRIKQAVDKVKNRNKPPATAARDTTKRTTPAAPATAGAGTKTTPPAGAKPAPTNGAKAPSTTTPASAPTTATKPAPPPPRPVEEPAPSRPMVVDEPYNSADTGTIAPGMSAKDVEALWGPPAALRRAGAYTYLLYPNGCEHSCGTEDVVILQNDQVVDAVLRWRGHGYSGQSSSPRALSSGRDLVTTP